MAEKKKAKKDKPDVKGLLYKNPHIAKQDHKQFEKADKFAQGYKEFLDKGKTERECVNYAQQLLIKI